MARLRRNFRSGTITDNPLAAGATTINSPGFINLPPVGAPWAPNDMFVLVLDPLGEFGTPEIVYVNYHGAADEEWLTVTRGQEQALGGYPARAHPAGTKWVLSETAANLVNSGVIVCTSGTRPTVGATDAGVEIYETDTKCKLLWTGTNWRETHGPRYAAMVYRSTNLAIAGGFASTAVPMNALSWADDNGVFQGGQDYTCLIDGYYRVTLNIELETNILCALAVMGLEGSGMPVSPSNTTISSQRATRLNMTAGGSLNAGAVIQPGIWNDGDAAANIREGAVFTWMLVERYGPKTGSGLED